MQNRVVVIRHGDDPPDDRVYSCLHQTGFTPEIRKPFAGELLGEPDEMVVGTVIHGGPYNAFATDEHPFLREEYRWIDACMKAGLPMLGICQGAQQIAHHLGASVGPKPGEPYEFGYYRVDPADPAGGFMDRSMWFTQSHFHMFDVPTGAIHLASSEMFENQAFRYGDNVYGLQFHPEVTIEGFRRWQNAKWATYDRPGAQTREEQNQLMHEHDARQAEWFYGFLSGLFPTEAQRAATGCESGAANVRQVEGSTEGRPIAVG